ncbi:hypothetical protein [Oceanisphaera pacifica]|uniref:Uncharacterized protein n=1 Tax=Oceanisphaera pacifica TaxID=2818389 RepID=A0ABS3NCD6_9GAMM|nr:hypothetical protein [Oceanisphaera pacifica]MBO1518246.1 hypothetical protein [Oceanisphaera pacifica]
MTANKKGLNPAQVQAPQSTKRNNDKTECSTNQQRQPIATKPATKTERAYMLLLSWPKGVTEGDILRHCRLSSGRNYASKAERALGIRLNRESMDNPDGIGCHYRYSVANCQDAERLASLISQMRHKRNAPALTPAEVAQLAAPYPLNNPAMV